VVEAMADLEPALVEADWSRLTSAVVSLGKQPALVVLLSALEPAAVEHGLLPALPTLAHRHRVVLASVRDPELDRMASRRGRPEDVYDAAAAEQVLADRARTAEILGSLGVDVVDADAESLPVALTDHYLMLKGRGLL
jgi:uncharacterized protein (DUF58 family)